MLRRNGNGWIGLVGLSLGLAIALGWNRTTPAQSLGRAQKGSYAEFQPLLGKHGDKGMLLEVHIVNRQQGKGEILGKVVQSTESLLVLKAQNQRDLYFVTWDDVIWITARPN
ncbi:MAG: hypothetical protein ACE5EQ_08300 [Phycisphaerae bacterium]